MPNPRLAGRYAKSLIGLAIEKNQLEQVYNDMLFLQAATKQSREFVSLIKSPVIKADKKIAILDAVTAGRVSELTTAFNRLLINKGREAGLPEIITAFIEQYKAHKGIHTVKLTTAMPVSPAVESAIIEKVKSETALQNVEMETAVDASLIGGFVLELGDTLVDASVAYDLKKIKSQFMKNDFIYNIR
jgi:F-type H+-transporting ATPase subunit delta